MATETMLVRFLIYLCVLFFIPKLFQRWLPAPITEVTLGALVAIFAAQYVANDTFVPILAALGVITLFVFAGLETDVTFIRKNTRMFIENIVIFLLVFGIIGFTIHAVTAFTWQIALIIGLAFATPSAGFIISAAKNLPYRERQWVVSKALAGEIAGLLVLAVLLGITDWKMLALTIIALAFLITLLPLILTYIYHKGYGVLRGAEFPFILVIALIAAFITDAVGLHFLVGAFVAGFVAKRFLEEAAKGTRNSISHKRSEAIMTSFGAFAATFAPFFFFSSGLKMTAGVFSWLALGAALAIMLVIGATRVLAVAVHRRLRVQETARSSWRVSISLLPTLVMTFVIAGILHDTYGVSDFIYGILMIYAIVLTLAPAFLLRHAKLRT